MDAVLKYAQARGYKSVIERGKWKEYGVYEMAYGADGPIYTGLPQYILVDGNGMRLAEIDEIFSILDREE